MSSKEVVIYNYLTYEEAKELKSLLRQSNISSTTRMVSYGDVSLYQVLINERDNDLIKTIIDNFSKSTKIKNNFKKSICPNCKSNKPITQEKKNVSFIRRLYSIGTKIMECKKCAKEWYV